MSVPALVIQPTSEKRKSLRLPYPALSDVLTRTSPFFFSSPTIRLPCLEQRSAQFSTFTQLPQIVNLSRVVNVLSAASDIGIAFVLIFLLQRSRTGFRRSETIINRLIIFTINTGLLTSMCAVMSLITVCVMQCQCGGRDM